MASEQKKNITEEVLWLIDSWENNQGGKGNELRIVCWVIDGKRGKPLLEKRDWYADADGEVHPGKARGLTAVDVAKVITNIRRVAHLLQMKDDHLDEALQLANQPWMEKAPEKKPAPAAKPQPSAKASPKPASPEPQPDHTAPETTF